MYFKVFKKLLGLVCICIFISGCATTNTANFKLPMASQITEDAAIGKIYIGPFVDMRKGGKVDTTIIGTIRGGYGNPLTRIRDEGGADEFVRDQMINAARKRSILADRKPDTIVIRRNNNAWGIENSDSSGRPILVGIINQLNVETGWSRGTIVDVSLDLINPVTGAVIWKSKLIGQDSSGLGSGIFESSTSLKQWLGDTIEKAVQSSLSSSDFVNVIKKK